MKPDEFHIKAQPALRPEMKVARHAHFLEHVSFPVHHQSTPVVLCAHDAFVFISADLGRSWLGHDLGRLISSPVSRCFTLRNGDHLLQTARGGVETLLVDSEFRLISRSRYALHNWHGSWSVDESLSGVIMYGEYAARAKELSVWRSTDGGRTWRARLTLRGLNSEAPEARHFHVCQADPFSPGRWLISTGDAQEHCRIWLSRDDGESWSEVSEPANPGEAIKPGDRRRIYRFTSVVFRKDRLVWVTDDTLGLGKAALVSAPRSGLEAARVVAPLGGNEMRTLTSIGEECALATSEAKLDVAAADVFLVARDSEARRLASIPNRTGGKTAFSRSLCSRIAHGGVLFSYDDGGVIDADCRFVRWELNARNHSEPTSGVLGQTLGSPGGAETSAVGCNLCLPEAQSDIDSGFGWKRPPRCDDRLYLLRDGKPHEYRCPRCDSRGRTRTLQCLFSQARGFLPTKAAVLGVSSTSPERAIVKRYFGRLTHVSLQGDHGDPECRVGIDITHMPSIPTESFDLCYACNVLDYIPDLAKVFSEARRILRPSGLFLFFIQPYRLTEDSATTVFVRHANALRHESYARRDGAGTGIPDCVIGIPWMLRTAEAEGLPATPYRLKDPLSDLSFTWFMCRKD